MQIEERKQHQARLLDKLSSIQVPGQPQQQKRSAPPQPSRMVSGPTSVLLHHQE
jgi:hypothetical protein